MTCCGSAIMQTVEQLERECRIYTRCLVGEEPAAYVLAKYCKYHQLQSSGAAASDPFDRLLLTVSTWGPLAARVADSYASRFYKGALLRRKLVLVLALLECSPPSFQVLDAPDSGPRPAVLGKLAWRGCGYVLSLALATVFLLPVHLLVSTGRVVQNRSGS